MSIQNARINAGNPENDFFVLVLNRMTSSNIENCEAVAVFDTLEQGQAFLEASAVESYSDGQWGKSYRKGGMLEWFNTPSEHFGQGVVLAAVGALGMGLPENPTV